jgi:hypothetical protein
MNSSLASISLFLGTAVAVLALSTPPISVKSVPVKAVFFDCDDCLYFDNWHVANRLTVAIEKYCTEKVREGDGWWEVTSKAASHKST